MTTPSRIADVQLVTNAVLEFLNATGLRIGDHDLPSDRTTPYGILYIVDDAPPPTGPPLTGDAEDTWFGVQVTSIGSRRDQAQLHANRVRQRILGRTETGAFAFDLPAIAGWKWIGRLGAAPSGVVPEGTAPNKLYNVPNRYTLHVTPA